MTEKIKNFCPKIAVFNGIGIYELFCGRKGFHVGKQPNNFPGAEKTVCRFMKQT